MEKLNVRDKVIRKDGKKGFVISALDDFPAIVQYDDGTKEEITGTEDFYLLGKTVYGNKIDVEEVRAELESVLEEMANSKRLLEKLKIQIFECKANREKLMEKRESLRGQLFVLENLMRPDWKEHLAVLNEQKRERKAQRREEYERRAMENRKRLKEIDEEEE